MVEDAQVNYMLPDLYFPGDDRNVSACATRPSWTSTARPRGGLLRAPSIAIRTQLSIEKCQLIQLIRGNFLGVSFHLLDIPCSTR